MGDEFELRVVLRINARLSSRFGFRVRVRVRGFKVFYVLCLLFIRVEACAPRLARKRTAGRYRVQSSSITSVKCTAVHFIDRELCS